MKALLCPNLLNACRKSGRIPSVKLLKPFPLLASPLFLGLLAACAAQPAARPSSTPAQLELTSPAFATGESIPQEYTCQGTDRSPALAWSAPPASARSLALLMEDPDAPAGIWVHWLLYDLPAETRSLPAGASQARQTPSGLPAGAIQGLNSFGRADYGGPCPPSGQHHYHFYLYAIDLSMGKDGLDKAAFLQAIQGHVLAQGQLIGVYAKP
jgi:Raf kinase inhibitor-like YbhB/YbcL family protein